MCLGLHDNTEGLMVRIFKEITWEMVWLAETREQRGLWSQQLNPRVKKEDP